MLCIKPLKHLFCDYGEFYVAPDNGHVVFRDYETGDLIMFNDDSVIDYNDVKDCIDDQLTALLSEEAVAFMEGDT